MSSVSSLQNLSFQGLADQFVEQIRRGGNPSIEEWALAYPAQAEEIRNEFPSLLLLEQVAHRSTRKPIRKSAPKQVCGCEIQDEIGRGGMGVVYRAYQREIDRKVAIKILYLDENNRPNAIERFQLERRAMARLDHPNIVPVYDYGNDLHQAFLVMKFIDGASLDRYLEPESRKQSGQYFQQLRGNWKKIAILGAEVASALNHAHENDMIHRDIKPANLILDRKGKVWVTDFGLAKFRDGALGISQTGDTIGTPRYMAPEQFRGISEPRSDVYSLGLSLYEIACGSRAWTNLDPSRIASQRSVLEVPPIHQVNAKVPKGLAEIIMKACSHRPEDRYQTATEFQFVLERFANGCSVGDRRSGTRNLLSILRRASIRNKIIGALAGVGIMGACAFLAPREKDTSSHVAILQSSPTDHKPTQKTSELMEAPEPVSLLEPSPVEVTAIERKNPPLNSMEPAAPTQGPRQVDEFHLDSSFAMIDEAKQDPRLINQATDVIKETLVADASAFGIGNQEKRDLLVQVDRIRDSVTSADFSKDNYKKFVETFKKSSLTILQRVTIVERMIGRSGLTVKERNSGIHILKTVVKLSSEDRVSNKELENLFMPIERSRTSEGQFVMSDNQLRVWLQGARSMIQSKSGNIQGDASGFADQLKTIVDKTLDKK